MNSKNPDLLILYSGGADSRLMLEFARYSNKTPYCLLINYNQLHSEELQFAKQQLEKISVPYQEVSISGLKLESGLTGDGEKSRFGDESEVSPWHVPGRNSMFSSIALSIAENLGIEEVWLGADYSDLINNFLDCTQEFVNKVDELYQVAASFQIRFRAPLLGIDKDTVKCLLKSFGVKDNDIFSGYGELENTTSKETSYSPKEPLYSDKVYDVVDYISLPALYFRNEDENVDVSFGAYRLEGHDPRTNGYGVIYQIPYDGKFEPYELENHCKYYVKIKRG